MRRMITEPLELDLEAIPGTIPELADSYAKLSNDLKEFKAILKRLETGDTELPYLEVEQYREEFEVRVEMIELLMEALNRAMIHKALL